MLLRRGLVPKPLGEVGAGGDLPKAAEGRTSEQWKLMALASGWTPELPRRKAMAEAFGSMLIGLDLDDPC